MCVRSLVSRAFRPAMAASAAGLLALTGCSGGSDNVDPTGTYAVDLLVSGVDEPVPHTIVVTEQGSSHRVAITPDDAVAPGALTFDSGLSARAAVAGTSWVFVSVASGAGDVGTYLTSDAQTREITWGTIDLRFAADALGGAVLDSLSITLHSEAGPTYSATG